MAFPGTMNPNTARPLEGCTIIAAVAGADLKIRDAVYFGTNGNVFPARANNPATAKGRGLVVAHSSVMRNVDGTVKAGDTVSVVTLGPVVGFDSGGVVGGEVFVSPTTAGAVTQTKPTGAGEQVVSVGYLRDDTIVYVQAGVLAPVSGS
jgi:hypothetical protein